MNNVLNNKEPHINFSIVKEYLFRIVWYAVNLVFLMQQLNNANALKDMRIMIMDNVSKNIVKKDLVMLIIDVWKLKYRTNLIKMVHKR